MIPRTFYWLAALLAFAIITGHAKATTISVSFYVPASYDPWTLAPVDLFPDAASIPNQAFAVLSPGEPYIVTSLAGPTLRLILGDIEPWYIVQAGGETLTGAQILGMCPSCGPGLDDALVTIDLGQARLIGRGGPMQVGFEPASAAATPEASSWIMLLLGFASLIGAKALRARRSGATFMGLET